MKRGTAKMKLPKTLSGLVDRLYTSREKRYEEQRAIRVYSEEEHEITEAIKEKLTASDLHGVMGKVAKCELKKKQVARITDHEKFVRWCVKTKSFDMLPKSCNDAAVRERWDAGKQVPGVEVMELFRLSVTKR